MPFTPQELQALDERWNGATQTAPTEEEIPYKRLKQVANIPSRVVGNLFQSAAGLMGGSDVGPTELEAAKNIAPQFEVGKPTGITDFLLNEATPALVSWALPYSGIGKLGKAVGMGSALTEGLAQGSANYLSSMGEPSDASFQGGVGLASGILQQALPRAARVLPLAAVSGLEYAKNDNALGAALNFGFNMLPKGGKVPAIRELPTGGSRPITTQLEWPNPLTEAEWQAQINALPQNQFSPSTIYPTGENKVVSGLTKEKLHYSRIEPIQQAHEFVDPTSSKTTYVSTKNESLPFVEPDALTGLKPTGEKVTFEPQQEGPHIISTVAKNEQGELLVGDKWNTPHEQGPDSIVIKHLTETGKAEGTEQTGFVIQDKNGNVRTTFDRGEAMDIAKQAGQVSENETGKILNSQDLLESKLAPLSSFKSESGAIDPEFLGAAKRTNNELNRRNEIPSDNLYKSILGDYAESKGYNEKVVGDFAWSKKRTPKSEQEAIRLKSTDRQGNIKFIEKGEIKTINVKDFGFIQSREGFWKLKPLENSKESGASKQEILTVLATSGLAGAVAYQQSKGDVGSTIAATVITAGLGAAGINAFKKYKAKVGPETSISGTGVKVPDRTVREKLSTLARDTAETPAGAAVGGRGGIWANSLHFAEGLLGIHAMPDLKHAKIHANGFIADQVQQLQDTFKGVKSHLPNVSPGFQEAEGRFLRGQLADATEVKDILDRGGAIHSSDWKDVSSADKAKYPEKWMELDDPKSTNTTGDGVHIWHVTNDVKQELAKAQKDALAKYVSNSAELEYMKFPLKYREVADTLMQTYHNGLPQGSIESNTVVGTLGQYITRSHAVISDPKAYPKDIEIGNAMDRLGHIKEFDFLQKKGSDVATPTKTVHINWKGEDVYLHPRDAADFQFLHSPESLRVEVRDYIKELKDISNMKKLGTIPMDSETFAQSLFTGRKELDAVTQALLGTHQAPLEMMQHTLNKLVPAAQVSHFMQDAVQMTDKRTGLKISLDNLAYNKKIGELKQVINDPHTLPRELDQAKQQLTELQSYSRMPDMPKFGLGKDTFVSRELKRQLDSFDGTPFGVLDNAVGRGLINFNQFFKTTHLALNPVTVARQFVQAPLMMAMGNVRDMDSVISAYKGYHNRNSGLGKWMNEWGVFSSSAVHGEFSHSIEDILSGTADKTIWDKVKSGIKVAQKLFSMPDDVVRASVFLNEAKRVSKELGVSLDSMNAEVGRRAMEFTARRAMDFSNLPKYVTIGRNIPFVNIFLGYTHEIMRITKNMAIDAARGDLQAGATLAGISALPFLAQKMAEDSLSTKDKVDWLQAQAVAPDYSRPRFKMPLSRNKDGTFNYLDITSPLPFNDFQMMARSILRGDGKSFIQVNPFVGLDKAPVLGAMAMQITGKDLHTEREFRGFADRAANFAQQMLPPITPGIGYQWKKLTPEALGGDLGTTNIKTGRSTTIKGGLLQLLTSVDLTQVNPDIAVKNYVRGAQEEIANARQYFMDTVKMSGKSPEAIKRAEQTFIEAVQSVADDLKSKINLTQANK